MQIYSPIDGMIKPLEEVNDVAFAQKMLGEGAAIVATTHVIQAPVTGTISAMFPTHHAIGITSDEGLEVLIHIGIDTVELEGKGFTAYVKQGQHVNAGDALLYVDFDYIKKSGYEGDVIVLISNSAAYSHIQVTTKKEITSKDIVITVE